MSKNIEEKRREKRKEEKKKEERRVRKEITNFVISFNRKRHDKLTWIYADKQEC
jgi:hypothetical protein